jgi:alcohol dehydrogenase class IV
MYEVPHGLICALFIRPVLRFNASAIREDCGRLLRCTEEHDGRAPGTPADPVEWLLSEIDGLFRLYGLPENLKDFRIREADIPEIARRSSGSSMSGNPVEVPQSQRERMLERLL